MCPPLYGIAALGQYLAGLCVQRIEDSIPGVLHFFSVAEQRPLLSNDPALVGLPFGYPIS